MTTTASSDPIVPRHIAVVMDGNGRWASKRFLPRTAGHRAGVGATRRIVENGAKHKIETLTLFAFSSENWHRPESEVDSLMSLFVSTLSGEVKKLHKQNVCVKFIGDRTRFSENLQQGISEAEDLTRDNSGMNLCIAANYGGRWDILNASKALMEKVQSGELTVDELTEDMFTNVLCLSEYGEPDLFIRTGGEKRISNFLIWQLAYTELYFVDTLWPDFDDQEFEKALSWYTSRQRRYGKTAQQTEDQADNNNKKAS